MIRLHALAFVSILSTMPILAQGIGNIQAQARNGQVFITWNEKDLPPNATIAIYHDKKPINNIANARLLAKDILPGSARNWWKDSRSFNPNKPDPNYKPTGFIIENNTKPLDPNTGLHVHTVDEQTSGAAFFAVAWDKQLIATSNPINAKQERVSPVWTGSEPAPEKDCAKGKALRLVLHGRGGGGVSNTNYTFFANKEQGWREGLAFDFKVNFGKDVVDIVPMDRTWINRFVKESADSRDHCNAINSWWFGYNTNINETTNTPEIIVDNYTQKWILAVLDWANEYLGTDPNRNYLTGGSMGGSASIAFGLQFPERFAALYAMVPVYEYTWEGCSTSKSLTAARLACACGPMKTTTAKMTNGQNVLDYMNGRLNIANAKADTPPIFATNGRKDASIPWNNNPGFYDAANKARQAFAVFWNDGNHGMTSQAPDDVKAWNSHIFKYALNKSFPAFSNSSDNKNYGNGTPEDGDLVGWINRGMDWINLIDTKDKYQITIIANYPGIVYPINVDVTLRRRQQFLPKPGDKLNLDINGKTQAFTMPNDAILTIPRVAITSPEGTTIIITK
jgi:dienelactone hydrolase